MVDSVDKKIERVLGVLSSGGTLYQQLVSGALLLCDGDGEGSNEGVNAEMFVALKKNKLIKYVATMGQGHSFFRGKVLTYKIAEE